VVVDHRDARPHETRDREHGDAGSQGEGGRPRRWVDRVVGLEAVRADIALMQTPDGSGRLELVKFLELRIRGR